MSREPSVPSHPDATNNIDLVEIYPDGAQSNSVRVAGVEDEPTDEPWAVAAIAMCATVAP